MIQADTRSASHSALIRPAATGEFALGLGLTNECNLACSFCYRDPARIDRLSLEQVRSVLVQTTYVRWIQPASRAICEFAPANQASL